MFTFIAVALTLVACEGSTRGGADALPGPVPRDASFSDGVPSAPEAPAFSLTLMDGTEVTGESLWKERPVVLFFFASWCGTCPDQQADITSLSASYGDTVTFLGVAGEDEEEAVADYLEEHQVAHAAGIDDDLDIWLSYAVREPPQVVVIARGGRVAKGWPGGTSRDTIDEALSELVDDRS